MRLFFALVAAIMLAAPAHAAPLVLTAETQRASLEGRLEHFADAANALSFAEIRQQDFAVLPEFRSLGYGTAAHLAGLTARGRSPHHRVSFTGRFETVGVVSGS